MSPPTGRAVNVLVKPDWQRRVSTGSLHRMEPFYVYADISHLGMDSPTLCGRWLEEIGVAATPGIDFDPEQGDRWVRFSYSESTADIAEAVRRLKDWAKRR